MATNNLVATVKSILTAKNVAFRSVAARFETIYIAAPEEMAVKDYAPAIEQALGKIEFTDRRDIVKDAERKGIQMWYSNLKLLDVPDAATLVANKPPEGTPITAEPAAPAAPKAKGKGGRKAKAPVAPAANPIADMDVIDDPLSDLESDLAGAEINPPDFDLG